MARRLRSPLSPQQRELLVRYGYPYVHEEFRFHMTLTGRVPRPVEVTAALEPEFLARVPQTMEFDRLAIFKQAAPEERFRILAVERFSSR